MPYIPHLARLVITDGTSTVDLLAPGRGIHISRWRPVIVEYKGGGTWQESMLATGRRLISRQFNNVLDTFEYMIDLREQDEIIEETQDLLRLLEKAADYFASSWQPEPVWIEARGTREFQTRYAIVHAGRVPELGDPYGQPFVNCPATMDGLTLIVEHGIWQAQPPTELQQVQISAYSGWSGKFYGNVNVAGVRLLAYGVGEVFIANKSVAINLTHLYTFNGAVYSGNLSGSAPHNLIDSPPNVGDITYFGVAGDATNQVPFTSLNFRITGGSSAYSGLWEYWNGASWVTIPTVADATGGLNVAGFGSVAWQAPANWTTTTVNGVAGWWVRFRITAVAFAGTVPQQVIQAVYNTIWGYTDIAAAQVWGDIPARAEAQLQNESHEETTNSLYTFRVIMGVRSVSRDYDPGEVNTGVFRAYLNPATNANGGNNPSNVSFALGNSTTNQADPRSAIGKVARYAPGIIQTTFLPRATWTISGLQAKSWLGSYTVFLRAKQTNALDRQMLVKLRVGVGDSGATIFLSDYVAVPKRNEICLVELGGVNMFPTAFRELTYGPFDEYAFTVEVQAAVAAAAVDTAIQLDIYDIIFIPNDEWMADLISPYGDYNYYALGRPGGASNTLVVDGASYQHGNLRAVLHNFNEVQNIWRPNTNGNFTLQANARQRLWMVTARYGSDNASWISDPESLTSIRLRDIWRYLGMRGRR